MTSLLLVGCLTGCSYFKKGAAIQAGGVRVVAVPDAGKPASLDTSKAGQTLPIPAGSKLTVTKFEAVPFTPATVNGPARDAIPAREVVQVELAGPSLWTKSDETVKAQTGTVDTSIAAKKIEAEESRILLYGALACVAAAGVFIWIGYPSPAMMCGGAAVVLFLAWKVSGLPSWFYVLGIIAAAGAAFLWLGHRRGEMDSSITKKY